MALTRRLGRGCGHRCTGGKLDEKHMPLRRAGEESVLEIRPIFEAEDFGEEFTPELREQEERLRAQAEQLQNKKA